MTTPADRILSRIIRSGLVSVAVLGAFALGAASAEPTPPRPCYEDEALVTLDPAPSHSPGTQCVPFDNLTTFVSENWED